MALTNDANVHLLLNALNDGVEKNSAFCFPVIPLHHQVSNVCTSTLLDDATETEIAFFYYS